jgi:hypothetical protein
MDMAKKVFRPDIYAAAAKELIAEGKMKAADFPDFANESRLPRPVQTPSSTASPTTAASPTRTSSNSDRPEGERTPVIRMPAGIRPAGTPEAARIEP